MNILAYFIALVVFSLLVINSLVCWYYLFKFVRTIMAFEDNHSDAIEEYYETIDALLLIEEKLDGVIAMPIFFENEELRGIIDSAKRETQMSRVVVRHCAEKFVRRTKETKISYEELYEEIESQQQEDNLPQRLQESLTTKKTSTVLGRSS